MTKSITDKSIIFQGENRHICESLLRLRCQSPGFLQLEKLLIQHFNNTILHLNLFFQLQNSHTFLIHRPFSLSPLHIKGILLDDRVVYHQWPINSSIALSFSRLPIIILNSMVINFPNIQQWLNIIVVEEISSPNAVAIEIIFHNVIDYAVTFVPNFAVVVEEEKDQSLNLDFVEL